MTLNEQMVLAFIQAHANEAGVMRWSEFSKHKLGAATAGRVAGSLTKKGLAVQAGKGTAADPYTIRLTQEGVNLAGPVQVAAPAPQRVYACDALLFEDVVDDHDEELAGINSVAELI